MVVFAHIQGLGQLAGTRPGGLLCIRAGLRPPPGVSMCWFESVLLPRMLAASQLVDAEAAVLTLRLLGLFVCVHTAFCVVIAFHDLTGRWEQHRLNHAILRKHPRWQDRLRVYFKPAGWWARDLLLTLGTTTYLWIVLTQQKPNLLRPMAEVNWPFEAVAAVAAYVLCKSQNMMAHYVFHRVPLLMTLVHGQHHYPLQEMVASAAWRATWVEFLGMELLGSFLLGPMLVRMHWATLAAVWLYTAYGAAVDHSGFKVNDWLDGEHHYMHHFKCNTNYSEIEYLDVLFGTKSHLWEVGRVGSWQQATPLGAKATPLGAKATPLGDLQGGPACGAKQRQAWAGEAARGGGGVDGTAEPDVGMIPAVRG